MYRLRYHNFFLILLSDNRRTFRSSFAMVVASEDGHFLECDLRHKCETIVALLVRWGDCPTSVVVFDIFHYLILLNIAVAVQNQRYIPPYIFDFPNRPKIHYFFYRI